MGANNSTSPGEVNNIDPESKENKELVFDSKDIGKKEKTEYFVRVEGAEERKKEVIRRMKQQKDELIRQKKAKETAEKREARKVEHNAAVYRRKQALTSFWFNHKKKVFAAIIILILIGAGFGLYRLLNPPTAPELISARDSLDRTGMVYEDFLNNIKRIAEEESVEAGLEWGEEQAAQTDDNHRLYDIYYALAGITTNYPGYEENGLSYALKAAEYAEDDAEIMGASNMVCLRYRRLERTEEAQPYCDRALEYQQKLEPAVAGDLNGK